MIQINPSTGKQLSTNTTRYSIASHPTGTKAVEAPYIVKRNGYYYRARLPSPIRSSR
jgi:arabinan endo-1,5-alpha-L-arabinosidase